MSSAKASCISFSTSSAPSLLSICVKLCSIHKNHKKQGSYALTRWTVIVTEYGKIRQLVLGNATVMQSTTTTTTTTFASLNACLLSVLEFVCCSSFIVCCFIQVMDFLH